MKLKKRKTMLKVRHNKVFDSQTSDVYAGERSPYRDALHEGTHESGIANPDILDESAAMYYQSIDDTASLKLQAIRECLPQLTTNQKNVLYYCGIKGLSQSEAAVVLHQTQQAISKFLKIARRKIMKHYLHRVQWEK